jgi:MFS transporter, FHS family, L-fucose permease
VACFVALLIILFWLVPFPEITDADMGVQENEISHHDVGPLRKQYTLFLGAWAQFCYVGAQVGVANYFINFCEEAGYSASMSSNLLAVAQALYAANRFIAGGMMTSPKVKPRWIMGIYLVLCFIFALAATLSTGKASVAMLILVLCAESACFATIFTLALRGLGRHTKRGGSFMVAAISGGAFV